ncbi:MAG: ATP-binding protein, partial [Verrucomicrobiota bacterium]
MEDMLWADDLALEEGNTLAFFESFLKGLVHKQNNIIGAIQGFASLAMLDDIPASTRSSIEEMASAAKSATELNQVILANSSLSKIQLEPFDFKAMSMFIESKLKDICDAQGVSYSFSVDQDLPHIYSDSGRLIDVLVSLTKNAADAAKMQPVQMVKIGVQRGVDDKVEISVSNPADDVSNETLKSYFEPFHSGKAGSYFGIGLTNAAVITGRLQGRLGIGNDGSET